MLTKPGEQPDVKLCKYKEHVLMSTKPKKQPDVSPCTKSTFLDRSHTRHSKGLPVGFHAWRPGKQFSIFFRFRNFPRKAADSIRKQAFKKYFRWSLIWD